jgi:hypothetical protein
MSDYLVRELERYGVAVRDHSGIAALHGADGQLKVVTLKSGEHLPFAYLFLFLGVLPCTGWLPETLERDARGFIFMGAPRAQTFCSAPASRESSRLEVSALARPSDAPPRSAKGRWRFSSFTRALPSRAIADRLARGRRRRLRT